MLHIHTHTHVGHTRTRTHMLDTHARARARSTSTRDKLTHTHTLTHTHAHTHTRLTDTCKLSHTHARTRARAHTHGLAPHAAARRGGLEGSPAGRAAMHISMRVLASNLLRCSRVDGADCGLERLEVERDLEVEQPFIVRHRPAQAPPASPPRLDAQAPELL